MLLTSRPSLGKEELKIINEVLRSGWLGMGSYVYNFEDRVREFLSVKHAIAVNTGTSALHISLDSLGIKPGDEVIVPSLTFASSVQAIVLCGAKPVFCDVCPDTLNMDIRDMQRRITRNTKAVMPVHYSGLPCDMDGIKEVIKNKAIRVVEDAAHAFGSRYKGRLIGSFGDIICFSFDPVKNITCGEGGMVITQEGKLAEIIRRKRILGIDKDTYSRFKSKNSWMYKVSCLGFRYHMSNINAAIGIAQMDKFDRFISRKIKIMKQYDNEFKKIAAVELLYRDYGNIAPFNYVIKVKSGRDRLLKYLKDNGIAAGVHYIPNHLQPFFAKYKVKLPVTEKAWKEIITLPLYYDMSDKDAACVIEKVKGFFGK